MTNPQPEATDSDELYEAEALERVDFYATEYAVLLRLESRKKTFNKRKRRRVSVTDVDRAYLRLNQKRRYHILRRVAGAIGTITLGFVVPTAFGTIINNETIQATTALTLFFFLILGLALFIVDLNQS